MGKCVLQLVGISRAAYSEASGLGRPLPYVHWSKKASDVQTCGIVLLGSIERANSITNRSSLLERSTLDLHQNILLTFSRSLSCDEPPRQIYQTVWPHPRRCWKIQINAQQIGSVRTECNLKLTQMIDPDKADCPHSPAGEKHACYPTRPHNPS